MYKFSVKSFCLTLCICLSPALALAGDITSVEALKILKDPAKKEVLLDVRTLKEHNAEHIDGSKMIDVKSNDFKEQVAKLDKNDEYIVYCVSGNRSGKAIAIMEELGFTNLQHMKDGIEGWKENNLGMIISK